MQKIVKIKYRTKKAIVEGNFLEVAPGKYISISIGDFIVINPVDIIDKKEMEVSLMGTFTEKWKKAKKLLLRWIGADNENIKTSN